MALAKELPCVLYKPAGLYCKIATQAQYDTAQADGWLDVQPKEWNNTPDPKNPGGTLPATEIDITAVPHDDEAKKPAAHDVAMKPAAPKGKP